MSKYIPKVGEKCRYKQKDTLTFDSVIPEFVNDNFVVGKTSPHKEPVALDKEYNTFWAIPTKADDEREQLIVIMTDISRGFGGFKLAAEAIQKADFTIPKKVKRSDIAEIINKRSYKAGVIDAICDLLGDLVEQDQ